MSDEQAPGGQAPPAKPERQLSIEEEERAMHTGSWKLPVFLGLGAVVAIGGIVMFVMSGSKEAEAEEAAGHLNRLHIEHYKAFWGCTKIPSEMRMYKTMDDVTRRVAKTAWGSEKRYSAHLKTKCLPIFGDYGSKVAAMEVPEAMQTEVRELADRIRDVRSSWEEFVRYLDRVEAPDEDAHMQAAIPVAKALAGYTLARNSLAKAANKARGAEQ